jgi:class 3 adenylate cyclase
MPISVAELRTAKLYDPTAPGATERLAVLQWLAEHGATLEQLVSAAQTGAFLGLAADLAREPGPRLTLTELSARTGVPIERIEATRFAAGLPSVGPNEAVLTEDDARTVLAFDQGQELFGADPIRRFTQMLGISLARMAEAAISLFLVNVEGPFRESGASELAQIQARYRATGTTKPLAMAIAHLFLAHIQVAARRVRRSLPQHSSDMARLTMGFVDLVGFTTLARQVEPHALATIIERFEDTAHNVAASRDGRIVKFIGDAVMFATPSARAACDIALTLVERFAGDPSVAPRGGLAMGDVLVRGGDYYGRIVNLAARIAEHAVPSEILVTEPVAAAVVDGSFRFESAGRRILKGFDAPVQVFTAARPVTAAG